MMNWLKRQMLGRYGGDQLSTALLILSVILMFLTDRSGIPYLMLVSYIPLGFCIFRILSRQIMKRRRENDIFLKLMNPVHSFFVRWFRYFADLRYHRYFKCPKCRQKLRVPKGKGKIQITCTKCHTEFVRKT